VSQNVIYTPEEWTPIYSTRDVYHAEVIEPPAINYVGYALSSGFAHLIGDAAERVDPGIAPGSRVAVASFDRRIAGSIEPVVVNVPVSTSYISGYSGHPQSVTFVPAAQPANPYNT
jgi:hypothetical protein